MAKAKSTSSRKKVTKTEKVVQHTIMVIDCSSSMYGLRLKTDSGVEEFQNNLSKDVDHVISLFEFSNDVKEKFSKKKPGFDYKTKTSGMTALYDAIGAAITKYKEEEKVVCLIITDGGENSSRNWNLSNLSYEMARLEKEKLWDFVYIGANLDQKTSAQVGINLNKSMSTNSAGIVDMYASAGKVVSTRSKMSTQERQVAVQEGFFTVEDYKKQEEHGNKNQYGFFQQ